MSHKITFREHGKQGPRIVLLHGFGGSVLQWDGVIRELQNNYRVLVINLSHLYSGKDKIAFSRQVHAVGDFLKSTFPGEKFNFAGISYGGALVWGLALRFPDIIESTIYINPMSPNPVPHFK